jgi:hypothetical protein
MSKHTHHRVVSQHWYNGELLTLENIFASDVDAINFANSLNSHTVKVYDLEGEVIHSAGAAEADTYA